MSNEMAHYACDCWDAECHTTYGRTATNKRHWINSIKTKTIIIGWVECVGCADRSCYDLTQHAKHSGVKLAAEKQLAQPKVVDVTEIQLDKSSVGKQFKQDAKIITGYFEKLTTEEINEVEKRVKEAAG